MALLDEVKDECGITWSDETTDRKISGIIVRAKAILDGYAGEPCDYDNNGMDRQLLCSLCRYIYNSAFEEFKENFSGEITALRLRCEASRTAKETDADADTQQEV